jgi:molybdopterin-containing oxidoreductase family membrane subunit
MNETLAPTAIGDIPEEGVRDFASVNRQILGNIKVTTRQWWIVLGILIAGVGMFLSCEMNQFFHGIGVDGMNNPTFWGTMLVNFVFWVGIGHAGTLISAILYLFRAKFRTAIARSAEAMTVFAVMTAGLFPVIHLGRVWVFYWLAPYPNQRELWPNFISPLMFDFVAISTYFTVSLLFWFTGLIPDLAAARDHVPGWRSKVYRVLSLGWSNNQRNWRHYARSYLFFAALATPLVISVHSVVSWDFALSIVPGWHSTIYPPYFVAGAIHSGFAMVLVLLLPMRHFQKVKNIITMDVLEKMAKFMIFTGLILAYSYGFEIFVGMFSQNTFEMAAFLKRLSGFAAVSFWTTALCNCLAPVIFFWKRARRSVPWLFLVGVLVNIGMWYERYLIIITQRQTYVPFSWGDYFPSANEIGLTVGAFCWFGMWVWLFMRFMPTISIVDIKEEIPHAATEAQHGHV